MIYYETSHELIYFESSYKLIYYERQSWQKKRQRNTAVKQEKCLEGDGFVSNNKYFYLPSHPVTAVIYNKNIQDLIFTAI